MFNRQVLVVELLPRHLVEKLQAKNLRLYVLEGTGQPWAPTHVETVLSYLIQLLGSWCPLAWSACLPDYTVACPFSTHDVLQGFSWGQSKQLSLPRAELIVVTLLTKGYWAPISTDLLFPFVYRTLPSLNYTQICHIIISSRASKTNPHSSCSSPLPARTAAPLQEASGPRAVFLASSVAFLVCVGQYNF